MRALLWQNEVEKCRGDSVPKHVEPVFLVAVGASPSVAAKRWWKMRLEAVVEPASTDAAASHAAVSTKTPPPADAGADAMDAARSSRARGCS